MKIFVIFLSLFSAALCQEQFKLCLHTIQTKVLCDQINTNSQRISCEKAYDSTECSIKVQTGEADFTVLYPEQVHLASSFISGQTSVIGEIRAVAEVEKPHNFQMVTVVKKDHTGGLEGLKGKKYCHPGFSGHDLWTPRVLKEFEYGLFGEKITKDCSKSENISNVEKEIKVLNEFFGDSCRRGPWSQNTEHNDELQKKYSKLTSLCKDSLNDPLSCLKVQNADVAYSTLTAANTLTTTDKDNYRILCRNGSLVNIKPVVESGCAWRNQPWTLILANSQKADLIRQKLEDWISIDYQHFAAGPFRANPQTRTRETWENTLAKALLEDPNQYRVYILRDTPTLSGYLQGKKEEINSFVKNECPVRWCAISQLEEDKCNWMAKATSTVGIEPQISCIKGENIYDCLGKIKNNNADIIAIDSNYGYLARKIGLQNLLYSKNSAFDIASIVAVIREESSIQSFQDLKSKKACFPEYRGLAWVSFITAAHTNNVMRKNCEFGKTVSEFFSGVCAPGAKDNYHYRQNNEVYDKLCSACFDNCAADDTNVYFDNKGALNCLENNIADVAFLEWQAIEKESNLNNYKILCRDNKIMSISEYKQNWASCTLSDTVDSEVITRSQDTRKTDYILGLSEMDVLFGTEFQNVKIFNMYKQFNGEEGLIFKENVLALDDRQSDNVYVKNYMKVFETADKCTSGASEMYMSISLLITSLVLFILH